MTLSDLLWNFVINLCADVAFVVLLGLLLWVLRGRELGKARLFFGFDGQTQSTIYVSGHEDTTTMSRRVVTALEYETAVEIREALRRLSGPELVGKLRASIAGVIGQDSTLPEPIIEVSRLDEVHEGPSAGSLILIGGPLRNQLTRFYLRDNPPFSFDTVKDKYLERSGGQYREIADYGDVAVVDRMVVNGQVVIVIFGTGERDTQAAARYLIGHWRELHKRYPEQGLGVLLHVQSDGKAKAKRIVRA